jgi:hypothetical protein
MSAITMEAIDLLERITKRLWKARIFARDVTSEDQAFALVLTGHEAGFSPTASARMLSIFHGRVILSSDAMQAVCVRHADVCLYFRCVETTDKIATFETKRSGDTEPRRLSYTIAQAERAGLTARNATYKAHTEAMLRARAGSALARLVYPELVAGYYDPSEAPEFEAPRGEPKPEAETAPTPDAPPQASAYDSFARDLEAVKSLSEVHGVWHRYARAFDEHATEMATGRLGDWLGERGYCVVATEQQLVLTGAWGAEECALADELAALKNGGAILAWCVSVRPRVEKLRDPKGYKTFIARSYCAREGIETTKPGVKLGAAMKLFEASKTSTPEPSPEAPDKTPEREPGPDDAPEGIVTSKGEVLATEAAVVEHLSTIDNVTRLENSAKKHGAHPWAFPVLVERARALLGMGADEADAWVTAKAGA